MTSKKILEPARSNATDVQMEDVRVFFLLITIRILKFLLTQTENQKIENTNLSKSWHHYGVISSNFTKDHE